MFNMALDYFSPSVIQWKYLVWHITTLDCFLENFKIFNNKLLKMFFFSENYFIVVRLPTGFLLCELIQLKQKLQVPSVRNIRYASFINGMYLFPKLGHLPFFNMFDASFLSLCLPVDVNVIFHLFECVCALNI